MGTFRKKLTMRKHRKMAKKLEEKTKSVKPAASPAGHAARPANRTA
jgi:hypothetical protein